MVIRQDDDGSNAARAATALGPPGCRPVGWAAHRAFERWVDSPRRGSYSAGTGAGPRRGGAADRSSPQEPVRSTGERRGMSVTLTSLRSGLVVGRGLTPPAAVDDGTSPGLRHLAAVGPPHARVSMAPTPRTVVRPAGAS